MMGSLLSRGEQRRPARAHSPFAGTGAAQWHRAIMEIEAKFRVADRRTFAQLLALPTLAGITMSPRSVAEQQRTTYFDSEEAIFRAQRSSLRVREVHGQRIATVKRSRGTAGSLHRRDEWETPIDAALHPQHWPDSPARTQALAILGEDTRPLIAQVVVHTYRQIIDASLADRPIAEICLDEGYVSVAGRLAGFRELEVELDPEGTPADLERICAALTARFPLVPEPLGKRTRGLVLLDRIIAKQAAPIVPRALAIGQ